MGIYGPSFFNSFNKEQFEVVGAVNADTADELGIGKIGETWLKCYKENGGTGHVTANMKNLVIYEKGKAKMPNARILIRRKK